MQATRSNAGHWLLFAAILGVPFALYLVLLTGIVHDPVWANPFMHFYIVSGISALALAMAAFMAASALQLGDVRVLLLSLAYLCSAASLSIHALTTPTVLVDPNPWVGFSGDLGIFLAAVFLALSGLGWSPEWQQKIVARGKAILWYLSLALSAYVIIALGSSVLGTADRFGFLVDDRLVNVSTYLIYGLLWFAALRLALLYRRHRGPVLFAMLASVGFLIETVVSMTNSDLWRISWWIHHLFLFFAFVVVVLGIALQYRRRSTLRGVLEGVLLRDSISQVEREYADTIIALIAAVEARDPYTHGHSANVARISEQIGEQLGMKGEALDRLHLAALLHDVGKIGIPDGTLLKPGKLTDCEFDEIREHPARGEQIVCKISSLRDCLAGIRSHHERMDGSGYPDGLAGEAIPLDARIIAVADSYDAMTSERPYRGPLSPSEAVAIIRAEAGVRLDPNVVAALLAVIDVEGEEESEPALNPLAAD